MKKFTVIFGKIICFLQLLCSALFLISIASLGLVPTEYMVAAGCVFFALCVPVFFLTWFRPGIVKSLIGIVLSALLILLYAFGIVYVEKTRNAIDNISAETEVVHIGIYVCNENAADYETSAKDYRYGYLQNMDTEGTDAVIAQLTELFQATPKLQTYQALPELITALLSGDIDAVVLNEAYLDVVEEMEGYENIRERIREAELKRIEIKQEITPPKEEATTADHTKPFGIYISGIDTRGSVSIRSRSDVNILAVVNPATKQVLLVSTPRDYYVPLSISNGVPDKLTHAGIYGINVSKDTLGMLYGIDMDYYFRINFSGFEKLIDALGGITVYSDYTFKADKGRHQIQKGENQLDGRAALAFCRERYALSGGDRVRGKHQMAVVQGVIQKALSPALLKNYNSVLNSVEGCFETTIPLDLIGKLVSQQLKDNTPWNIVSYSVDGTGDYQVPYSMSMKAYVMQPNMDTVNHAKELIQKVYAGEILDKE